MRVQKPESPQILNQLDFLKTQAFRLARNEQDAQDLAQDVVLKALENLDKFQSGTNLRGWLYVILRNAFINSTRRSKICQINCHPDLSTLACPALRAESRAYAEFERKEVERAIESLASKFRIPFSLHFQGYKYEEIAEQLQLPIGTLKNRIHRDRVQLKAILFSD
ncbi:MAG: sigma-70 family RNA polymerase sigma factor [Bacteroidia bacterium]|nr:sigma-70 family RNA polymerase sigma factor [Bacteroidia bacterium]